METPPNRQLFRTDSAGTGLAPWSPSILSSLPAPAVDAFQCLPEGAVLITTDASSLGGGGTLWPARQAWACGWTESQAYNSSNWRELKMVMLALAHWQPLLQGKWVVVRSDNNTTVAVINKGYSSAAALNELADELHRFTQTNGVTLCAVYLLGVLNETADELSQVLRQGWAERRLSSSCTQTIRQALRQHAPTSSCE
uniref:RNase H type-1 domain-containing protein n=1 Tax=Chromera velia CCMP2878 TaxID=1169474 RepID=A0A0K6S8C0_9ALVE|eukprot:Cvel_25198.t1-p1 / transcript=Cvel_25198.t1 / gene=Cvel_25198 / organism=Chromera_velia_CCMP2878 / gene_product=hypothetical protein / transcript_product=hypothetical protein / location=Cvel_scaffold2822:18428-19018(+) / protein_length=197 / sequence_SO=supercontig / SO=protein_coding / is_pseudo=false